ncbi:3-hydroxyacyl-CoA dehydrogenase [Nitratireductor mangrovi]|uniref:3-hydroxyacyl-CoA dehydrogenase n=1 Tax=Nitratireductor mangrovi TaxID=2599600 RepID=A0A5B8L0B7_9HYPH|nr:3-hydroxyacyl-CoA dehydrogenase [Nitratireductor mangrovi]QDZ01316.1 3-hydroxyacyl-CoA dehydrogenase [Nitratireductor mangrovi]
MRAGIIGTGLIGRGWATAFARAGWDVSIWDHVPAVAASALSSIKTALDDMAAVGLVADPAAAAARVVVADTLSEAVDGADYVQENVPENVDAKRDVFELLDKQAPQGVPVASSSSTIIGSRFLSGIRGRDRCIVAHPANPPHLMPVVEVAPSPWHADAFVGETCRLLASIGQVPVVVRQEIEGFVMNRLQTAVVNEAVALVARGVMDPADVDAVMKHSLGLRWSLMGPFETMDLNAPDGFLDYATRYGHLYQAMGRDLHVADAWQNDTLQTIEDRRRRDTPRAAVGERMRWRDRALMRLMSLKNEL